MLQKLMTFLLQNYLAKIRKDSNSTFLFFFIHLFHVLNFFKSYFQIYAPEGQIFANYNNFIHLSTRYYNFFLSLVIIIIMFAHISTLTFGYYSLIRLAE